MNPAASKGVKGPTDPDHHAAWVACREPDCTQWGEETVVTDLRVKLAEVLASGWTMPALKEYAFNCWRHPRYPNVTRTAWRMAVWGTDYGGKDFLARYNERHAQQLASTVS